MDTRVDIKENKIRELDKRLLALLLKDHTTGKNIIWATDNYESRGRGYYSYEHIEVPEITGRNGSVIKPRTTKSKQEQLHRVKDKAEVFTPSWICNQMANALDEEWFGRKNVFNIEQDKTWQTVKDKIVFPEGKTWQDYVNRRCLEITCGEVPFLVSRYDTTTGDWIEVNDRIGVLDRKLRVINENVDSEPEWVSWVFKAFKVTYGYEWQGDSLLIARENLLYTFIDYYEHKFTVYPLKSYLIDLAKIVSWNIFQMDGLKYVIPNSCKPIPKEATLFDLLNDSQNEQEIQCEGCKTGDNEKHIGIYPTIMNWSRKHTFSFYKGAKKMKFDFIIGNPPYQNETLGDNKTYAPQIYNIFMDAAYNVSEKVEMIHPARFLFNAGSTPKKWNEKMLNDEHFKVCHYFPKSAEVFPNTDIKGGVAITYRDLKKKFIPICVYTSFPELNEIKNKVIYHNDFSTISKIVYSRTSYRLTKQVHKDYPNAKNQLSDGHLHDMSSNIFERLPQIFFETKPNDGKQYVILHGRFDGKRTIRYIRKDYVSAPNNFDFYKVFMPGANGSGAIGEVLSTPLIGEPLIGATETFISIGRFKTLNEAESLLKYVKTKFARTLLGILKVTQAITPEKWRFVPLQDFTDKSDIDWSKSIHEIDLQLYKKYGLDKKEIDFIETHVQEMK